MRIARLSITLILALVSVSLQAQSPEQPITLVGKLVRTMAIGAESTGWTLELDSATTIGGKEVTSIQVRYRKTGNLEKLQDQHVTATGSLTHQQGVETGDHAVLNVSSMKAAPAEAASFSVLNTEWLLEDLSGNGVVAHIRATLAFPEAGRLAGNGSCNRFFGTAVIHSNTIKLGPLGATRMACPEAVMNQETKYLEATTTGSLCQKSVDRDRRCHTRGTAPHP